MSAPLLFSAADLGQTQSHLHRIQAGIGNFQPGIRNVHIPYLNAPGMTSSSKLETDGGGGGKVDGVGFVRDIVVGEQGPAAQFKVGRGRAPRGKIPFQIEGIESSTIRRVGRLKYQVDRAGSTPFYAATIASAEKQKARRGWPQQVT